MRIEKMGELLFEHWRSGNPTAILILGPPGIGKTSVCRLTAALMTEHVISTSPAAPAADCVEYDLSSKLPEDLGGLPYRGEQSGIQTTFYATPKAILPLCIPGSYGILCLDDLPASTGSVQVAARQGLLERRFGDSHLSDGVLVVATGNRREDKSAARTLPAHLRNSVCILTIEPDLEGWATWYGQQPSHEPIVSSFLRFRPSLLSQLPKDAGTNGSFATPRTWAKLGSMWAVAVATNTLLAVAQGLVGEGPAMELVAWHNLRDSLVDPEAVLLDPRKAMPDGTEVMRKPDTATALATGLGERAAAWVKGDDTKRRKDAPQAFIEALAWCTTFGGREYTVVALNTFVANGGSMSAVTRAIGRLKKAKGGLDVTMTNFLEFVAESMT